MPPLTSASTFDSTSRVGSPAAAGPGAPIPARVSAVNRYVRNTLILFLALVALGWVPLIPALHMAATRLPIFEKERRMGDMFNASAQMQHFSALTIGPTFNYPAPAAFVLAFFLRSNHPKIYFILAVVAAVGLAAALLWLALRRSALRPWLAAGVVLCFAALGQPQIFVLDRANLEWVGWILLVLSMACFFCRRYLPMALLLGVAMCMKPFPILFFLLLLYRRRYKEIAIGFALAAALNVIALWALGPSVPIAYKALHEGMQTYKHQYIESVRLVDEMRFDHALMSPVRMVLFHIYGHPRMEPRWMNDKSLPLLARMDYWRYFFSVVGAVGVLSVAWFGRRLPTLNQILLLCLAITLLPYISGEYTLLILYIPFGLMLIWMGRDVARGEANLPPFAMLALFALLLAPLGTVFNLYVGIAQCALLITLAVYAFRNPMPMRWLDAAVPGRLRS